MKNTEYITIKENAKGICDCFVGDEPAETYRARPIYYQYEIAENFQFLKNIDMDIEELHIGAFDAVEAKNGVLSGKFGPAACYRLKLKGIPVSDDDWDYVVPYNSPAVCASNWANRFLRDVRKNAGFRSKVLDYANRIKKKANEQFEFVSKVVRTKGDLRITIITEKLKSNGK